MSSPVSADDRIRLPHPGKLYQKTWSSSQNCGYIVLRGGPLDGEVYFDDHNLYDSFGISDSKHRVSYSYKPVDKGRSWVYRFDPESVSWW